jgi:hypothetical protein
MAALCPRSRATSDRLSRGVDVWDVRLGTGPINPSLRRLRQNSGVNKFEQPRRLKAPVRGASNGIAERAHKFLSAALGRNAAEGGNIEFAIAQTQAPVMAVAV